MQSQTVNKAIDWISEQDERFNVEIFMLLDGQERGSWVRAKAIQDLGKAIEIDYETTGIVPKRINVARQSGSESPTIRIRIRDRDVAIVFLLFVAGKRYVGS